MGLVLLLSTTNNSSPLVRTSGSESSLTPVHLFCLVALSSFRFGSELQMVMIEGLRRMRLSFSLALEPLAGRLALHPHGDHKKVRFPKVAESFRSL